MLIFACALGTCPEAFAYVGNWQQAWVAENFDNERKRQ